MNYRLISEMEQRLGQWHQEERDAARRVRSYLRDLRAYRKISPQPLASIALVQRQCVAARKLRNHAAACAVALRRNIRQLSGTTAQ